MRKSALPTIFCPGCGHGTLLNVFIRVMDDLRLGDRLGLVSGIGCSSWTPVFIEADVLHTLHGRAIAVATGLKLANPCLDVVVFTGDGDCLGIGGNHFIHGARRNIDLTVIMLDNNIYGMTGGQTAPTTPLGAATPTSPHGNPEPPFDACALAVSAGASHVARYTTAHPRGLFKAIKAGIMHKGFSFIHVLSQCPTQAGRYIHGLHSPNGHFNLLKQNAVTLKKAGTMSPEELEGRHVIGTLHHRMDRPELTDQVFAMTGRQQSGKD